MHACVLVCSVVSNSFVTPWTIACQALLSMDFIRQEYWNGLPFPIPEDFSDLNHAIKCTKNFKSCGFSQQHDECHKQAKGDRIVFASQNLHNKVQRQSFSDPFESCGPTSPRAGGQATHGEDSSSKPAWRAPWGPVGIRNN